MGDPSVTSCAARVGPEKLHSLANGVFKVTPRKFEDSCPLKIKQAASESRKEASKKNKSDRSKENKETKENKELKEIKEIKDMKEIKEDKEDKEDKENKSLLIENVANDLLTAKSKPNPKPNTKSMKEEKNKADTKRRNRGKGKDNSNNSNTGAENENVPMARNKGSNQETPQPASETLPATGSLANEVAKVRQHLIQTLQCMCGNTAAPGANTKDIDLTKESIIFINELKEKVDGLESRLKLVEEIVFSHGYSHPPIAVCPAKPPSPMPADPAKPATKEEDDDVDLFGSDSEGEDAEAARIREERLAAYAAKKAKKPALIAKSNIILDVKPWGDTTDMVLMESEVRKIEMNGLLWGAAKLVPLAFGIHKLQISCVVEDDKVSVDELTEKIQDIEDYVQSVDIAAFNKI